MKNWLGYEHRFVMQLLQNSLLCSSTVMYTEYADLLDSWKKGYTQSGFP
jgi:hypothetical protein